MSDLNVVIPGVPVAKARPRFVRRGRFVSAFNPQESAEGRWLWELRQLIPAAWEPMDGPVYLSLEFVMPIPASVSKRRRASMEAGEGHTKKPDLDNCVKFVLDCCNGLLWWDDKQIVRLSALKRYGAEPGTRIIVMDPRVTP